MILYCDGDSFIAGTELADDLIIDHPGYLPYGAPKYLREQNKMWITRTYSGDLANERDRLKFTIHDLEKKRCFATKVANKLNVSVVNESKGGSSMDAIARRTITNLINLKKQNPNIIALIGTSDIWRSEISYAHDDWICIQPDTTWYEGIEEVVKYKTLYEKNYHGFVRFYKNIITIKDFCKVNDIQLHFIQTHFDLLSVNIEEEYKNRKDYVEMKEYANLQYSINMLQIAIDCKLPNVLCPSSHYSEDVHSLVADKVIELL
jgi:hypothetical protein